MLLLALKKVQMVKITSRHIQVILTLILIDVQYVQNVAFSFEKSSNGQNHFSSDSDHPTKKSTPQNLPLPQMGRSPLSRNAILKTLNCPFTPNEDFLEKLANISITFVYLLFPIMLKCFSKKSLEQN